MSIYADIEAALLARVSTLVTSPALAVAWQNRPFTPPSDAPYLRVTPLRNRNERINIKGAAPHRRQGILTLIVVWPLDNAGATPMSALADAIAEHFPADLQLHRNGLRIRVQSAPDVGSAIKQDASFDVPVSVRWECFA